MKKKIKIIKAMIFSFFWILLIGSLPSNAQTSNIFSDESCVINNRIKNCFTVINWDYKYSDTIYINTTDSVIAIHHLPGQDVFYLNYFNKSGFIVFELISKKDPSAINNLPLMKRKITGDQWKTIFPNMKRANNKYIGSGISEKKLLAETWLKLQWRYKKNEKSLVIVIQDPPITAKNVIHSKRNYMKFE